MCETDVRRKTTGFVVKRVFFKFLCQSKKHIYGHSRSADAIASAAEIYEPPTLQRIISAFRGRRGQNRNLGAEGGWLGLSWSDFLGDSDARHSMQRRHNLELVGFCANWGADMRRTSVLIVEGDQKFALDLHQRLETMGYEVFGIAATCGEALASSSDRRPDIVLMDIDVEKRRDSLATAALLRREHGVPVIYLGGQDDMTFRRANGVDPYRYLRKPVREEELRRALEMSLQQSECERAIRDGKQWFSTTLGSLTDGVVTFNPEDEILFINPVAEALALAVKNADPNQRSPLFEMKCLGKPEHFSFIDTDGHNRMLIRTKTVVSDDFSVLGEVLVLREITEQIENGRKLATASRMATLGTLAAGVAHEINNPLTVIVGNSSLLGEQLQSMSEMYPELEVELSELVEIESEIQDAAERIRSIVSGMMVLAHPGRGGASLTSVVEAVERAVKSTRYEVEHRAFLLTDVQPDLPEISIDPGKLSQVLINLIANASQSMASANRTQNTIQVSACLNGEQVQISVSDNGTGMNENTKNQVFDAFFTTKEVGQGTGLGLSICRAIIVDAGGTLFVESLENVGTRFTILLPLEALPDSTTREELTSPRAKVLIIESDSKVQILITRTLNNYNVVICATFDEALDRLQLGEQFDAVLIDLNLGTSSFEFYDKIAAIDAELVACVVFAAGGGLGATAEKRLSELPNFSLRKPYDIRNLKEVMSLAIR